MEKNQDYDQITNQKLLRREQKRKKKMKLSSVFLKQIPRIQEERYIDKYGKKEA